jgi:hypothetical protein
LEPDGDASKPLADPERSVRFCSNYQYAACNWLVEADCDEVFCRACRHNRTVPDLTDAKNLDHWRKIEVAKRRLFYTLLKFGLPIPNAADDSEHALVFDFLADAGLDGAPRVLTGHDNGIITIALAEADDAEREKRRTQMHEPYRTLLGHFRHEVGHYYWDILVRDQGKLDACRALFGDDTRDYGEALQAHYAQGAPEDWPQHFVSAYASSHPWEDFAETWAHYLHIVDTLEMAAAFGLRVDPKVDETDALTTAVELNPYQCPGVDRLINAWLPITFAMNSLNRCMGATDLYPFVLTPPVVEKLGFIHALIQPNRGERQRVRQDEGAETAPLQARSA